MMSSWEIDYVSPLNVPSEEPKTPPASDSKPLTETELVAKLAQLQAQVDAQQTPAAPDIETGSGRIVVRFAIAAGAIWAIALLIQNLPRRDEQFYPASLPIQQATVETGTAKEEPDESEDRAFAEERYEFFLNRCIAMGESEWANYHGTAAKHFQREAEKAVETDGTPQRITLASKLNYTRNELDVRTKETPEFGGSAQQRDRIRDPLSDSLSVLYALKAEREQQTISGVRSQPSNYIDCLDELSHWLDKSILTTRTWKRLAEPPTPRKNDDWSLY